MDLKAKREEKKRKQTEKRNASLLINLKGRALFNSYTAPTHKFEGGGLITREKCAASVGGTGQPGELHFSYKYSRSEN